MNPQAAGLPENTQFCSFRVGGKLFALDIVNIIEIVRHRPATPIPRAPSFIEGYLDLRGAILPVVDLKKRLELSATEPDRRTRIVILRVDRRVLGFIVEEVVEIFNVPRGALKSAPAFTAGGVSHEFLKAVYNGPQGMVLILDIRSMLSAEEHTALSRLGSEGSLSAPRTGGSA